MITKMRLYHRRSSASKDRAFLCNAKTAPFQTNDSGYSDSSSPRLSLTSSNNLMPFPPPQPRQRSHSLFPGGEFPNSLQVPQRSRSNSFSGIQQGRRFSSCNEICNNLISSEEDDAFKRYARVMYIILGITAATVVFFVLYALYSLSQDRR